MTLYNIKYSDEVEQELININKPIKKKKKVIGDRYLYYKDNYMKTCECCNIKYIKTGKHLETEKHKFNFRLKSLGLHIE